MPVIVIRRLLVLLSLIGAMALALLPAAAHASTAVPALPSTATTSSSGRHVTPVECAALRANLGKPALKCADLMAAAKFPASTSSQAASTAQPAAQQNATPQASGTYWTGYLLLCQYSGCSPGWAVNDNIGITFIHKDGVWNNSHSCSATSGITVSWCSTWHNGYSTYMEEGFNFSPPSGGYARLEIDTYGNTTPGGNSAGAFYYCLEPPGDC